MRRSSNPDPKSSRLFVNSLARGLNLLEALAGAGMPKTLTELSKIVGFNKVTTSRFCHTLMESGYIEKLPSKHYQLTPKVLSLGYAVICSYDLRRVAQPYLRELSKTLQETVNMAVLEGTDILYVARFKTETILATELHLGSRLPVYCTSMGKAILAHLPESEQNSIIERIRFVRLTHKTLDSREALQLELEKVRRQGFAVNDEELSVGLRSIAAPVMRGDRPVAAVNIAVPTIRYSRAKLLSELAPPLLRTARTISRLLDNQILGGEV
jgi:IclR family pca regulon transcriptional regulator